MVITGLLASTSLTITASFIGLISNIGASATILGNELLLVQEGTVDPSNLKLIVILVIASAFIAIFGLVFVIRAYNELKKQYKVIQSQHREITEKNDELAFKNESLEELNMEKNNMISVVAHDLKTPLGNIQGLIELIALESDKLSEDQVKYLDLLKNVTRESATMVDVMLNVYRIESDLHQLTLHEYDLIELINKVVRLHHSAARLKKVKIVFKPTHENFSFKTDKQYFHQIISNILQNAVDHSHENTGIIIRLEEKSNSISISITDFGPGISKSDQKRIFTGYTKVEGDGSKLKSTGVGLNIVHRLLEKLHGKISVQSEVGKGSTFTVELFK